MGRKAIKIFLIVSSISTAGLAIAFHQLLPFARRIVNVAAAELPTWLQGPLGAAPPAIKESNAIRLGILGAATIAPPAAIWPAYKLSHVEIVAVAARTPEKARRFAKKYGIPKVHETYLDLLDDPNIDAIFNPLPNGLHAYWSIQALRRGKHVLCEKPFASNAVEAAAIQAVAAQHNLLVVEAFHWRFHPFLARLQELIAEYTPTIRHVRVDFVLPYVVFDESDIRFNVKGQNSELAGGALMDLCYTVNFIRTILGMEPDRVLNATMEEAFPGVDQQAMATLEFAGGATTASLVASFNGPLGPPQNLGEIHGMNANRIVVKNFVAPFLFNEILVYDPNGQILTSERIYGSDPVLTSTYDYQLDAFARAVQGDSQSLKIVQRAGGVEDAVQNMKVIDAIYQAAGLQARSGLSLDGLLREFKTEANEAM